MSQNDFIKAENTCGRCAVVVGAQDPAASSSVKPAGVPGCLGPHGPTLFLPRGADDAGDPLGTLLGLWGLPVEQQEPRGRSERAGSWTLPWPAGACCDRFSSEAPGGVPVSAQLPSSFLERFSHGRGSPFDSRRRFSPVLCPCLRPSSCISFESETRTSCFSAWCKVASRFQSSAFPPQFSLESPEVLRIQIGQNLKLQLQLLNLTLKLRMFLPQRGFLSLQAYYLPCELFLHSLFFPQLSGCFPTLRFRTLKGPVEISILSDALRIGL